MNATIPDFIDQLLDQLGIDPEDLDDTEYDELEQLVSEFAQVYWTADTLAPEPEV